MYHPRFKKKVTPTLKTFFTKELFWEIIFRGGFLNFGEMPRIYNVTKWFHLSYYTLDQ